MRKEEFLPLGSIVLLENGQKRLSISGYCIETPEEPGKTYDYCGVVYPEGMVRSDIVCVFDRSQIKEICHIGYNDEESKKFLDEISQKYKYEDNKEISIETL